MRLDVVGVVVLVQHERAGRLPVDALGRFVIAARVLGGHVGGRHHHLGAERFQRIDLLRRHLVGHGEDAAVSLHRGPERDAHAGVAARVLDDGRAGLDPPFALRLVEDVQRHAILDGAAGVHEFALGIDRRVLGTDELVQPDEGRLADRLQDVVEDGHRVPRKVPIYS